MQKMKPIAQHMQDSPEERVLAEIPQTQHCIKSLAEFLRRINAVVVAVRHSSLAWSKQPDAPQPMEMSDLLTGRYSQDVSRRSLPSSGLETKPPPGNSNIARSTDDADFPDARAKLFAQLGIGSEDPECISGGY